MSNNTPNGIQPSIPTISSFISHTADYARGQIGGGGSSSSSSSTQNTNSKIEGIDERADPTLLELVQLKFKDNERVVVIFEAYQIHRGEHTTQLLALVESLVYGTFAVFSYSVAHSPPRSPNDLTIKEIFALDESFHIHAGKKGIAELQFTLSNGNKDVVQYFYYPLNTWAGAVDFVMFHAQVVSAKSGTAAKRAMAGIASGSTDRLDSVAFAYVWLNDYRPIGEAKQELKRREHEFTHYKTFSIYCATWNVNDKWYDDCSLHLWLSKCDSPPDIYAIALQEMDTSKYTAVMGEERPDVNWIKKMMDSVHPDGDYEELTTVRLCGMQLTIILRKEIRACISRCRIKSIPRGIFLALGNKGGVAVSLQLNETNICFVNSHLAAHQKLVERRNQDYAAIVADLVFDDDLRRTIDDHDQIFWIGDLNYRIEEPPGPLRRYDWAAYEYVLAYDQLRQEMLKGNCFVGYEEGAIRFLPTYKYDMNTDNYDSSEKQRAPAFCDRILWKGLNIEQLSYGSVMEIRLSDHKPVYAQFSVMIKTRDEKLYKIVHEEVLKQVDRRENESQPQLKVNKDNIAFDELRFNELAIDVIEVSNTCLIPVKYKLTSNIDANWLQVQPRDDTLLVDQTKSAEVRLHINASSIREVLKKLPANNDKFDIDVLILQVEKGSHIFLPIMGKYKPSCFGLSMETLCRTKQPICEYTQSEIYALMRMKDSGDYPMTMPCEFYFLMEHLYKLGDQAQGAFSTLDYKCNADFNAVRDWLDSWSESPFPGTPKTAAEAVLMLLDLPEYPLLYPMVEVLLLTTNSTDAMELIARLSPPRRNVFAYLSMFLRDGIEKKYYNLHTVASIFGSILLRSTEPIHPAESLQRQHNCRDFMYRIICSDMLDVSHATTVRSSASASSNTDVQRRQHNIDEFPYSNDGRRRGTLGVPPD